LGEPGSLVTLFLLDDEPLRTGVGYN
jgi:hypothetical protein